MPIPDIRNKDQPVGPLRRKQVVTLSDLDVEIPQGFICLVVGTGDITYRCVEDPSDQTETIVTTGTIIGVGNHPVVLGIVRGHLGGTDTTITSLVIGRL